MKNQTKHIFEETSCIPLKDLMAYQEGKLSPQEVHKVEKHLTDCMFCNDALEGFAMVGDSSTVENIVSDLNTQINLKLAPKSNFFDQFSYKQFISIAASVLIVITFSFLIKNSFFLQEKSDNMAFTEQPTAKELLDESDNTEQPEELNGEEEKSTTDLTFSSNNSDKKEIEEDNVAKEIKSNNTAKADRDNVFKSSDNKKKATKLIIPSDATKTKSSITKNRNTNNNLADKTEDKIVANNNSSPDIINESDNVNKDNEDFDAITSAAGRSSDDNTITNTLSDSITSGDNTNLPASDNIGGFADADDEEVSSDSLLLSEKKERDKSDKFDTYYKSQQKRRAGSQKTKKVNKESPAKGYTSQDLGYNFNAVLLAYKNGEYPQAINMLKSLLYTNPSDKSLKYTLGLCYLKTGYVIEAKQIFRPASVKSKKANFYEDLDILEIYDLINSKRTSKAIKILERKFIK